VFAPLTRTVRHATLRPGRPFERPPVSDEIEQRYQQRLTRYTTAMRNGKPDCVPIRPFVAEFTSKYAGFTAQQVTHDYTKAFEAALICARDFDWDAIVPNMVYVWTGLTEALTTKYYGVPGIDVPIDTGFQYREPANEADAFMRADEYEALAEDPTGFLANVWLPRVTRDVKAPGEAVDFRHNMALVKGGMAMMQYFMAFGGQIERMRRECGTVSAIAGILKSPFDIIADKLRGYEGLTFDLFERPDEVLRFYWPTLKPIIEELWARGHQTLFYAEGRWKHHWQSFRELPEGSIIYHCDQDDVFEAHAALGDRFAISGGVPNMLLSYGKPDEVRAFCKRVIDEVARDGGYIMDAGAIMQNDTSVENIKAMTDFTREYGVY